MAVKKYGHVLAYTVRFFLDKILFFFILKIYLKKFSYKRNQQQDNTDYNQKNPSF